MYKIRLTRSPEQIQKGWLKHIYSDEKTAFHWKDGGFKRKLPLDFLIKLAHDLMVERNTSAKPQAILRTTRIMR